MSEAVADHASNQNLRNVGYLCRRLSSERDEQLLLQEFRHRVLRDVVAPEGKLGKGIDAFSHRSS